MKSANDCSCTHRLLSRLTGTRCTQGRFCSRLHPRTIYAENWTKKVQKWPRRV